MRPQSAAVRGNPRVGGLSRPQSAPLPRATEPKLLSRAELDEISQKMYDRGAAYAARRDKLRDDHIEKLNGWKLRVEVRPAVYAGEMRFKYMSAPSKLALDEGRTYESEGKTWRKNVVSEAERRQYIDHFYGDARRKKVGTATPDPPCPSPHRRERASTELLTPLSCPRSRWRRSRCSRSAPSGGSIHSSSAISPRLTSRPSTS